MIAGTTTIGSADASPAQDIVIHGAGIERQHCYITNDGDSDSGATSGGGGVVTLHPLAILCTVDGLQLNRPTRLSQGKNIGNCCAYDVTMPFSRNRYDAVLLLQKRAPY